MRQLLCYVFSTLLLVGWTALARADIREGQEARLFRTIDENLQPVDMAKLIDGRPLVLLVGSCS